MKTNRKTNKPNKQTNKTNILNRKQKTKSSKQHFMCFLKKQQKINKLAEYIKQY